VKPAGARKYWARTQALNGFQNPAAHSIGHIRLVVDNPGDGLNRATGFAGNVLDGYRHAHLGFYLYDNANNYTVKRIFPIALWAAHLPRRLGLFML
jgi:hypothetical protein